MCFLLFLFFIAYDSARFVGFDRKPRKSLCLSVCVSVCDICELSTLSKREILRLVRFEDENDAKLDTGKQFPVAGYKGNNDIK